MRRIKYKKRVEEKTMKTLTAIVQEITLRTIIKPFDAFEGEVEKFANKVSQMTMPNRRYVFVPLAVICLLGVVTESPIISEKHILLQYLAPACVVVALTYTRVERIILILSVVAFLGGLILNGHLIYWIYSEDTLWRQLAALVPVSFFPYICGAPFIVWINFTDLLSDR